MANRWETVETGWLEFSGLQNHYRWWLRYEIKRCLLLGRKVMTNLDSILKSRDITLPTKVHLVRVMVFPVVMYGCESWTIKKAECWRIDTFELWCWGRLLRVPWTARRSNQSILKDQSWVFIGKTDVKAKTPVLWPSDAKSWLIWKDSDAGKGWGQEEKGTTENEIVGWHHWLNGQACGWTLGVCDGQGGLACCDSWDCKESDMTEQLNWAELNAQWTSSKFQAITRMRKLRKESGIGNFMCPEFASFKSFFFFLILTFVWNFKWRCPCCRNKKKNLDSLQNHKFHNFS